MPSRFYKAVHLVKQLRDTLHLIENHPSRVVFRDPLSQPHWVGKKM
jgi:hypothetical protein